MVDAMRLALLFLLCGLPLAGAVWFLVRLNARTSRRRASVTPEQPNGEIRFDFEW